MLNAGIPKEIPEPTGMTCTDVSLQDDQTDVFTRKDCCALMAMTLPDPLFLEIVTRLEQFDLAERADQEEAALEATAAQSVQDRATAVAARPAAVPHASTPAAGANAAAAAFVDEWEMEFIELCGASKPPTLSIADRIVQFKPITKNAAYVRPRGLDNLGNMCYMNAMLHPLLLSGPFYSLLKLFSADELRAVSAAPLLLAMYAFGSLTTG